MITYNSYPLPIPDDAMAARIEQLVNVAEFHEFQSPEWTGLGDWQTPDFASEHPVKLGTLYWPRMASKWAVGHFVVDEATLVKLRGNAYTSDGPVALPLVIDDGTNSITTDLFMLPPRPLFQWDDGKNLYLLTLVDDRYFWRFAKLDIAIDGGTTTWADVYDSLGPALGTITDDAVSADYLKPATQLTEYAETLPAMLDAVAYSVQQRIVRKLDGTVLAQGPTSAKTTRDELIGDWAGRNMQGGTFAFDATQANDLPFLVPDRVGITFPYTPRSADVVHYVEADLATLALDDFANVNPFSGVKRLHSTGGYDGTNGAELTTLANAFGEDWYKWQAYGSQCRLLAGVVPWDGDGTVDYVEWEAYAMRTRVVRDTLNDVTQHVYHYTSAGSPDECCGDWIWTSVKTSDYTASSGEAVPVNCVAGHVQITLPSSPAVNDQVMIVALNTYAGGTAYQVRSLCSGSSPANYINGVVSTSEALFQNSDGNNGGAWVFTYSGITGVGWVTSRRLYP